MREAIINNQSYKWQKVINKFYDTFLMTNRQQKFFFKELNIGTAAVFGLIVVATAAGSNYKLNYGVECATPI